MRTLHIIGGGLSGLAAAVAASKEGWRIVVHEAATQAGGRCRSFHDSVIGRTIDNGNHLVLGANRTTFDFLNTIGSQNELLGVEPAQIPFLDLRDLQQWTLRPGLPWWPFASGRGVPDAKISEFLMAGRLFLAGPNTTVGQCVPEGTMVERFWSPFATAALNTDPQNASAQLLAAVLRSLLLGGERANRPYIARNGLSQTFIDPAIQHIQANSGVVRLGERLRSMDIADGKVQLLRFGETDETLDVHDRIVLATPPQATAQLLPELMIPLTSAAIVNAHYRLDQPVTLPGGTPLLGIIGGIAQWLFARHDVVAVTVSAADELASRSPKEISELLWSDVARALSITGAPMPPHRIIKEQRATFTQSPIEVRRRPLPNAAGIANLVLAGDWTATGLPATIEGSIRSGRAAIRVLRGQQRGLLQEKIVALYCGGYPDNGIRDKNS